MQYRRLILVLELIRRGKAAGVRITQKEAIAAALPTADRVLSHRHLTLGGVNLADPRTLREMQIAEAEELQRQRDIQTLESELSKHKAMLLALQAPGSRDRMTLDERSVQAALRRLSAVTRGKLNK